MKRKKKLTPKDIMNVIESNKKDINRFGVRKIGLFGSFLKEEQGKKSDIDILVDLKNPTFDSYMELKFLLEELLKRKVDLVIIKTLKPSLRYVKREAVYARV